MINLIHGDCLAEMKKLGTKSVDLILTSPPYNMNLRIRNGKYASRQIVPEISTKYGWYDDNLPMEDYYTLLRDVVEQCLRVSRITFLNIQMVTGNKPALFRLLGQFHQDVKEVIIWDKVNAQPAIGQGVLNSQFEFLLVLTDTEAFKRQFNQAQFDRGTLSDVWQIKREPQPLKGMGAAFPKALVRTVLENFTQEGQTVLDPFMGSGTTKVVSQDLNRKFIGIELAEKPFNFAKERTD